MSSFFASQRPFRFLTVASTLLFAATTSGQTPDAQLCGISSAWPNSDGQYIFNNNAWGDDGSGAECTSVSGDGASFATQWSWSAHGNDTHSFPNVQLNTALFPLSMSKLAAMNLQASWTMTPVDSATRANIVYDMFIDADKTTSSDATTAKYEVMIWIGAYGDPFPIGASTNPFTGVLNASLPQVPLAGTTFSLYSGENSGNQTVHSWLALTNQTDFTADVTPLITYLTKNNLVATDTYLGLLQFGSETWHSTANVTFDVTSFNLNVTSTDASANAKASAAVHPSATSGSSTSTPSSSSTSTSSSADSSSSSSSTGSPSSPASTSEVSSLATVLSTSSTPTIALTSSPLSLPTSLRPLSTSSILPTASLISSSSSSSISSITTETVVTTVPSLTPTSPGSSSSSATGSSSSSSSTGGSKSGSSITSIPFWFWEIAAAGVFFAVL